MCRDSIIVHFHCCHRCLTVECCFCSWMMTSRRQKRSLSSSSSSNSIVTIWIKDAYCTKPVRVLMKENLLMIDLLELVLEKDLFESITTSPLRINQFILKLNGSSLSYDTNIKAIEGKTDASNPIIVEEEENCKFCFSV